MDSYHGDFYNGYTELLFPSVFGFSFQEDGIDDYILNLEDDVKKEVLLRKEEFHSRADIEAFVDNFEH